MANSSRTCFVISPIGLEGSETRQSANDFFELIVEPALEKYGFSVIRADRIAQPNLINTDIVKLVQEADLCLIDLTSNNPNVFYECGRRHETGKPFIQLVKSGEESGLPFDVAGIRTVSYDVSSPRTARDSVLRLQEFIDTLVSSGFQATTSGDSLASVAQGIDRIERKLNQILSVAGPSTVSPRGEVDEDSLEIMLKSPRDAFLTLLRQGKLDQAYAALDRVKRATPFDEYMAALGFLSSVGHGRAFERMDSELREIIQDPEARSFFDQDNIGVFVEAVRRYHENIGQAAQGVRYLQEWSSRFAGLDYISDEAKAVAMNKVGMMAWTASDYDTCERYTKMALAMHKDTSYIYNLGLLYEAQKKDDELRKTLDELAKCPDLDNDHRRLLARNGY
jgi:tetratricopeptide (TPR) repeat protein